MLAEPTVRVSILVAGTREPKQVRLGSCQLWEPRRLLQLPHGCVKQTPLKPSSPDPRAKHRAPSTFPAPPGKDCCARLLPRSPRHGPGSPTTPCQMPRAGASTRACTAPCCSHELCWRCRAGRGARGVLLHQHGPQRAAGEKHACSHPLGFPRTSPRADGVLGFNPRSPRAWGPGSTVALLQSSSSKSPRCSTGSRGLSEPCPATGEPCCLVPCFGYATPQHGPSMTAKSRGQIAGGHLPSPSHGALLSKVGHAGLRPQALKSQRPQLHAAIGGVTAVSRSGGGA